MTGVNDSAMLRMIRIDLADYVSRDGGRVARSRVSPLPEWPCLRGAGVPRAGALWKPQAQYAAEAISPVQIGV
jgi:hypothetical protein